jgi:hypothetical protein
LLGEDALIQIFADVIRVDTWVVLLVLAIEALREARNGTQSFW